jgi:hypothetical protein
MIHIPLTLYGQKSAMIGAGRLGKVAQEAFLGRTLSQDSDATIANIFYSQAARSQLGGRRSQRHHCGHMGWKLPSFDQFSANFKVFYVNKARKTGILT